MLTSDDIRVIEGTVRYLTAAEGGRRHPIFHGYRGQFFYAGADWDGFQYFPDLAHNEGLPPGAEARVFVTFSRTRWDEYHAAKIRVGLTFKIREGHRTVGHGTVTRPDVSRDEWQSFIR